MNRLTFFYLYYNLLFSKLNSWSSLKQTREVQFLQDRQRWKPELLSYRQETTIQLPPDNSNLVLTQTKIDFPWISVIHLLGGLLPYISYIGMCHPIGQGFCPFWSGIRYGSRRNYGDAWTYLSCQFQMSIRKKERNMRIRNGFEEFFCLRPNLSNDDMISA